MKQFIWFFSIVLVVFGHNTSKPSLNLEQLGNVSRFFSTAPLCEHKSDVKTRYDDDGRLVISFKTYLKPNESDDDLCKCMWKYINQECWLFDVERKCIVKGKQLTLQLTGPPNPDYDPMEPLPVVKAPVATLADVMKYYPAAEIADHICSSKSTVIDDGQTCLLIQCKLTPQSPKPEKLCQNLIAFINQCEWLGAVKTKCYSKDVKVVLDVTGK